MGDDKTKKKRDARRISINQPYEVRYAKQQARKIIELINKQTKSFGSKTRTVFYPTKRGLPKSVATSTIKRICQAFLKFAERK